MLLLLKSNISKERKRSLRKALIFFRSVEIIDNPKAINWKLRYNRNNQTYRMLIEICRLVIYGLLQTNRDGTTKMMDFLDEQRMSHLYEKFILRYYSKEFPGLKVSAAQIPWAIDDNHDDFLPRMQSDIMLQKGNQTLIIDAKYYSHTMQTYHETATIHSHNLYQIFTYVKNQSLFQGSSSRVAGILLYARTNENIQPDLTYSMSGNQIKVKTLDLNCDFAKIRAQLDGIANDFFDH